MTFKLIACEVFRRELDHVIAGSPHTVIPEFLPKGLHDLRSSSMRERLQASVDAAGDVDAVLLAYALCGLGLAGVRARSIPLVIPRAHDCIAVFLGSRARYNDYVADYPGTYFLTVGWIEAEGGNGPERQIGNEAVPGLGMTYAELVRRYGDDNASYLYDEAMRLTKHYSRMAFIRTGVEPGPEFRQEAERRAAEKDLAFVPLEGDLTIIRNLVHGTWDGDMLVVPPGHQIVATYDDRIIDAVPAEP